MKKNKFGISIDAALKTYEKAKSLKNIEILGLDCHIGSQLTDVSPFIDALKRLRSLIERLRQAGVHIRYLDLGGGLGIVYDQEAPPQPHEYAREILRELEDIDCTLIFEPGRVIVGNAGVLVSKVLYTKRTQSKNFVIADGAMNDLVRPSLYGSYHYIQPVVRSQKETEIVDVVGPICESGDFLARDRGLPMPCAGRLSGSDECWSIRVQYVLQLQLASTRPGSAREGRGILCHKAKGELGRPGAARSDSGFSCRLNPKTKSASLSQETQCSCAEHSGKLTSKSMMKC